MNPECMNLSIIRHNLKHSDFRNVTSKSQRNFISFNFISQNISCKSEPQRRLKFLTVKNLTCTKNSSDRNVRSRIRRFESKKRPKSATFTNFVSFKRYKYYEGAYTVSLQPNPFQYRGAPH